MLATKVPSGNQRQPGSWPCSVTSFQRSVAPNGASSRANHCCRRAAWAAPESTTASTIQRAVNAPSSTQVARFVCKYTDSHTLLPFAIR